jgi:tRNA-dihydrouridine synthase 3
MYETYGYCHFGITCRFCSKHVEYKDERFENLKIEEKFNNNSTVRIYNVLTSELKQKLWKKRFDFKRSKFITDEVTKYVNSKLNYKYNKNKGIVQKTVINDEKIGEEKNKDVVEENGDKLEEKKVGSITDEDIIKLRDCEKKKIDWKNKLYLAPLTTVIII